MLGKLGNLLNRDVGALVKDAGKVLNTDVGTLAKGAGRVLNADLGDLLRSPPPPPVEVAASVPVGDLVGPDAPGKVLSPPAVGVQAAAPPVVAAFNPDATLQLRPSVPASVGENFNPDATLQLRPADRASAGAAEIHTVPALADALVARGDRQAPQGTSLVNLLPYDAGEFARPHATPAGELTSDPVSAIYRGGGDTIAVKLVQCWDADEAREHLEDLKALAGAAVRVGTDGSWVLGQTNQGTVFAWNRDTYAFTATSPKGPAPLAKFLSVFPY